MIRSTNRLPPICRAFSAWVRCGSATRHREQMQHDAYGSVILGASQMFIDERLPRMGDASLFRRSRATRAAGAPPLSGARRRHLGVSRAAAHPHALGHDVLGRLRPAGAHRRCCLASPSVPHTGRSLPSAYARRSCTEPGARSAAHLLARSITVNSMPAFCCSPISACLPPDDPRFVKTCDTIGRELMRNGFIAALYRRRRFRHCRNRRSLLANSGTSTRSPRSGARTRRASCLRDLSASRNTFGMLSEDLHPRPANLWGNIPQTYSMAGLINSAMTLSRRWEDAWSGPIMPGDAKRTKRSGGGRASTPPEPEQAPPRGSLI